jgi:hypothetical protein
VLWARHGAIALPWETRRAIARDLDLGDLTFKPERFTALLDRLWVLGAPLDPWTGGSSSLPGQIDRHVFCELSRRRHLGSRVAPIRQGM